MLTGCGMFVSNNDGDSNKTNYNVEFHTFEEMATPESLRYPFTDGLYRYTLYDTCAVITERLTDEQYVKIPSFVENVPVIGIGPKVFENDTVLQSVTMGRCILRIGESAFRNCTNLTVVEMSDSVAEIQDNAFAGCERLRSIKIPSYLVTLDGGIFANCKRLKKVVIEPVGTEGATRVLDGGCFSGCQSLEAVWIPEDVTVCSDNAFGEPSSNMVIYGTDRSASAAYAAKHLVDFVVCPRDAFESTSQAYQPLTRKSEALHIGDTVYSNDVSITLRDVKFYDKIGSLSAPEGTTIMVFVASVTNRRTGAFTYNLQNSEVYSYKASVEMSEFRTLKKIQLLPGSLTGYTDSVYELSANETALMAMGVIVSLKYDHITVRFPGTDDAFIINSLSEETENA